MAEPQDFSVDVLRPDDLLVLRFESTNLHLVPDGEGRLERSDPRSPPYVVVVL